MKRTILPLLLPLLFPPSGLAEMSDASRYAPLAESMIEMMSAMGSAMSQYGAKGAEQGAGSWPGGVPLMGGMAPKMPAWTPSPSAMPDPRTLFGGAGDPALNGSWVGQYGELLIVRGNRFRIYTSAEEYRDGELHVEGDRLILANPITQSRQPYEYAQSEGRLALRGPGGDLLLFRKISDQQKFSPHDPE